MLAFIRNDAELRQLERLQLDLAGRELLAERGVLDDRLAAGLDLAGEIADAAQPLLGDADAGDAGSNESMDWSAQIAPSYFNNRKVSIYGGSNEIQRNIITKAVLGL